jgi:predicted lipoprotein with Yx(FWY)xxD motif
MRNMAIAFILLFLAGAAFFAGCTQPTTYPTTPVPTTAATAAPTTAAPATAPDSVKLTTNPQYGQILTDASGMTLYYFVRDSVGAGRTACTGSCATNWPPFYTAAIQVSAPLSAGDFATFTRSDGQMQVSYMGWPLYHYAGDKTAGDTNGYGFNKLWYVMSPTGVVTLTPTTTVPTTPAYSSGGGY